MARQRKQTEPDEEVDDDVPAHNPNPPSAANQANDPGPRPAGQGPTGGDESPGGTHQAGRGTAKSKSGVLYSTGPGRVTLGRGPTHEAEGDSHETVADPRVSLNGEKTVVGDLKRGDRVVLLGEPVNVIEAVR